MNGGSAGLPWRDQARLFTKQPDHQWAAHMQQVRLHHIIRGKRPKLIGTTEHYCVTENAPILTNQNYKRKLLFSFTVTENWSASILRLIHFLVYPSPIHLKPDFKKCTLFGLKRWSFSNIKATSAYQPEPNLKLSLKYGKKSKPSKLLLFYDRVRPARVKFPEFLTTYNCTPLGSASRYWRALILNKLAHTYKTTLRFH